MKTSSRYSVAEARDRFARMVREAEAGHPAQITRRGEPVAVVVSVRAFDGLTGERPGFVDALREFRASHDAQRCGLPVRFVRRLRDRSAPRTVDL